MFLLAAADLMFLLLNNQGKRLGFRLGPPDRKPSVPLTGLTKTYFMIIQVSAKITLCKVLFLRRSARRKKDLVAS